MFNTFLPMLREGAAALSRRVGTAFATWLVAQGVPSSHAEQAVVAIAIVASLGLDLVSAHLNKKARP